MPKQRWINTDFWDDKWVQSLPKDGKHLFMFLLTNPKTNIAGIYKITIKTMSDYTEIDQADIIELLQRFEQDEKVYLYDDEWLILINTCKHQKIREKDNNRKGVNRILEDLPDDIWQFVIESGYSYEFMEDVQRTLQGAYKDLTRGSEGYRTTLTRTYTNTNTKETLLVKDSEPEPEPPKYLAQAHQLTILIDHNDPGFFKNKDMIKTATKWADDIRLLIDRDGRDVETVEKVIAWSQQDAFWKTNILSGAKLRKQFPQLLLKMKPGQNGGPRDGKESFEGVDPEEYYRDNTFEEV